MATISMVIWVIIAPAPSRLCTIRVDLTPKGSAYHVVTDEAGKGYDAARLRGTASCIEVAIFGWRR
jgi:hypothetical protein